MTPLMSSKSPLSPASAPTLQISLNGEARRLPAGASLFTLLEDSKLSPEVVAIEVNRRLVRSVDYGRLLAEGDSVEIVTFVGGG